MRLSCLCIYFGVNLTVGRFSECDVCNKVIYLQIDQSVRISKRTCVVYERNWCDQFLSATLLFVLFFICFSRREQ